MLKKIPVSRLHLGMHLHGFEGSWFAHPFLRARFVLEDPADLERIRASRLAECWIDVSKGRDVETPAVPDAPGRRASADAAQAEPGSVARTGPTASNAPTAPRTPPAEDPPAGTARVDLGDELERAAALRRRSAEAMRSMFANARLGRVPDLQACEALVQEIADSVARHPDAFIGLVRLKSHDEYTYLHSAAVCALMVGLARELGLDDAGCREAGLAGMLHDIGKTEMPLAVLNKPGRLDAAEMALIREHPARGHERLRRAGITGQGVLDVCLHHHEKLDGSGYPHGLAGQDISLLARMGAVCDVYDAVTSERPYNRAWEPAEALARMASWKGHFDPPVLALFVRLLGIYPVGSLVRLNSGRLAVVCESHATQPRAPVVKAFYSTRSKMPVPVQRIDLSQSGCADAIAGPEPLGSWNPAQLQALWAGGAAA